jgi:hypothetical protein
MQTPEVNTSEFNFIIIIKILEKIIKFLKLEKLGIILIYVETIRSCIMVLKTHLVHGNGCSMRSCLTTLQSLVICGPYSAVSPFGLFG